MVWPSTKCEPMSRIAWRVAVRTAGRPSRPTISCRMLSGVSCEPTTRAEMPSAQAEAETSSAGERTSWAVEVSRRELVLDEAIGGGAVGHPQQRFGEHHQREALLGGERVLAQEVLDTADATGGPGADRGDERAGAGIDALLRLGARPGGGEEPRRKLLVGRSIGGTERTNATFHGFPPGVIAV